MEGSGRGLIENPGICMEGLTKTTKNLRTAGVPGPGSNRAHIPNTGQERYLYTNLFPSSGLYLYPDDGGRKLL
jgi:hypothetical protein